MRLCFYSIIAVLICTNNGGFFHLRRIDNVTIIVFAVISLGTDDIPILPSIVSRLDYVKKCLREHVISLFNVFRYIFFLLCLLEIPLSQKFNVCTIY